MVWLQGATPALILLITLSGCQAARREGRLVGLAKSPWPKFRCDARNSGLSSYPGAQQGQFKWRLRVGKGVRSSPAVGPDGTVYLGGVDDGLLAVSPDGRERWRFRSEYDCSDVCPAVAADGTVYFAAGYATDLPLSRSRGCLYALSPEGTLRWRYKANGSDWSAPSVGADGTIYITAGDDLVAVARHGKRRWSIRLDLLGGADSCPAIDAAGSVYVWGWDFFAVRPTGQGEWRISVEGDSEDTGPAIGTDGTMYVGAEPWYFYAWASRGSVKWRVRIDDGVFSWPAIAADGTVYVGACDNNLYALRPDGSQKWRFPTGGDVRSSPAIGADGTIYVGAKDGSLYAIAPDGKQKWRFQTGGEIWSSPAIGIGSTVYVVSDDQYLYAIN